MASTISSHQTRWYNKRMLRKGYSAPRNFSWIENYKLKKQVLKQFFLFVIHTILKISMTKVWHKHNLIVSSVGSDHPEQYSYEITYEYFSGWEKLLEKIISTKRKRYSPYRICRNFLRQPYFWRSYFFTFLRSQNSYFFGAATVFQELLFQNSRFFAAVTFFQNSYFFRAKLLPSSQFTGICSSLW